MVFGGQPFADALFERLHLRVGVESVYGDDRVVHDRIVGLEDQLAGRQRDVAHRIALLGVASVDAGHAVDVVVDFDRLAQRVVAAEEYSFERLVDDDHLAVVVDVGLIDETSLDDLDAFDLLDLGQRAAQADVGEAVEVGGRGAAVPRFGGDVVHFGEFIDQNFEVPVFQVDAAPFVVAGVGLRGPAAGDGDRVGGVVAEIRQHAVLESVARSQQDDEHEDAPRD